MVRDNSNQNGIVALAFLLIFISFALFQSHFEKLIFTQTRAIRIFSEKLTAQNKLDEETISYLNGLESKVHKKRFLTKKGALTLLSIKQSDTFSNLVYQNTGTNQINWELFLTFPRYDKMKSNLAYPTIKEDNFLAVSNLLFDSAESFFKNKLTIKQGNHSLGLVFLGSVHISELKIVIQNMKSKSSHTFIIAEDEIQIEEPLEMLVNEGVHSSLYFLSNSKNVLIQNNSNLKGCNCSAGDDLSCIIINSSLFSSVNSTKFLNFREKCIFPHWPTIHEKDEVLGKVNKAQ